MSASLDSSFFSSGFSGVGGGEIGRRRRKTYNEMPPRPAPAAKMET